jgi:RHS repeat-associated protein
MKSSPAITGCPTGTDSLQYRSSCAPARRPAALADINSFDQPKAIASEPAFIHYSLEKFAVACSAVFQSNHRNQQYSVIAVTDDTGAIAERYSYTAYGEPAFFNGSGSLLQASQFSIRHTYTGREYDSTIRLYHYRARMYDPQLGRFLGRDPIGHLGSKWNLFRYVEDNPLKLNDPFGKIPGSPWGQSGPFANEFSEPSQTHVPTCKEIFDEWKQRNPVNPGWASQLPACPCNIGCKICIGGGRIGAPGPVDSLCTPESWKKDPACGGFGGLFASWYCGISTSTHPGASGCIRKKGSGNATQQCCYDRSGDLITGGVGAGTPDLNNPNHEDSDVKPWLCAAELDGNPGEIKDGPHIREYIARRPPNNANGCKSNVR